MKTVRLPVKKIMLDAFLIPWQNHAVFLRALTLPTAALTLISILFWFYMFYLLFYLFPFPTTSEEVRYIPLTSDNRYIFLPFVLYFVFLLAFFILFAATVHRIVLLGHNSVPRYGLWKWTEREWRFLGWLIVVAVISAAIHFVSAIVIGVPVVAIFVAPAAKASGIEGEISMPWLGYILAAPATYIFARLSLLFPATAIDRRPNLRWAWDKTKNNGWRMVVIVGVLPWLFSIIAPYLSSFLILFLGNVTMYEVVLGYLVGYGLLLPIEITALSLSYKELTDFNDTQ